jgi:alkanesulfonate monooxygenase SsuD/methylene tetrahydromethanopterin reductase-like flavin-dependent oxidoreductase (luciferase family)
VHVGMTVIFQNPEDARPDHEVYADDLRLADLAEPLGFESVWGVEHHFTDYTMCPDVLQFLTWMAARTKRIQVGSMVVVLPWHDPLRVAEQVAMLDVMSGGRLILGIGRGLGRVEFEGFRVPMHESRERFVESAQLLLGALEDGFAQHDGNFVKQPRVAIRPKPPRSFRGRTYAAAVSPESSRIMAQLGIGILIIPQKPWEQVTAELADYRRIYREVNGADAPPPICAGWTFCDQSAERAREMALEYIGGYWRTVLEHYELRGEHLASIKGYESYARLQEIVRGGGADALTEFFLSLQVWGTPEQCFARVMDIRERTGAETFVAAFSYAGMPIADAEASMRLFAREVKPELQKVTPRDAQTAGLAPTPAAAG